MFLHLIKLIRINDWDRIFLAIHCLRRKGLKELGERDNHSLGTKCLHGRLNRKLRRSSELQALHIVRSKDRPHIIRHIPEAVVPMAQQIKALLLSPWREPLHAWSVQEPEGMLGVSKNEGH